MGLCWKKKEYDELRKKFPNANLQVNHKNLNTLDPSYDNIEWSTEEQNKAHSHYHRTLHFGGKVYKLKRSKE